MLAAEGIVPLDLYVADLERPAISSAFVQTSEEGYSETVEGQIKPWRKEIILSYDGPATFTIWTEDGSSSVGEGNVESPKTAADEIIRQLIQFESLDDDWDGNGASMPMMGSLRDARTFIRSLSPNSELPMATLHADGHAVLLLIQPGTYAEIEFLGQSRFGYYVRQGTQEWGDESDFGDGALPAALSQIGFAFGR